MSGAPLFGLLIEDRTPFGYEHFWGLLQAWLQDAGGFAMLGLLIYMLYALRMPAAQAESAKERAGVTPFMLYMSVAALLCYSAYIYMVLTNKYVDEVNVQVITEEGGFKKYEPPKFSSNYQPLTLMIAGLFSILGVGQPFASSLFKIKFRRIWALSTLGFKEAVRNKMLLVFLLFLIPLMIPITWFLPFKPEDELRMTIGVTSGTTQVIIILTALLMASFAIPTDIKNQNLYTIVTKPVERFEVLLGRFFGYMALITLALFTMTLVGWIFILGTTVDQKAKDDTYKARVPVKGKLKFQNRKGDKEGTNVGREFDYRKYIAGDPSTSERAVWNFEELPSGITAYRDHVPVEFTFDIFRMTKGEENRGVDLVIRVVTWQCPQTPPTEPRDGTWKWADAEKEQAYRKDYDQKRRDLNREDGLPDSDTADPLRSAKPPGDEPIRKNGEASQSFTTRKKDWERQKAYWGAVNDLAKKYGYYEKSGKEIFDYHTDKIAVPVGLFENAQAEMPKAKDGKTKPVGLFENAQAEMPKAKDGKTNPPRVSVYVKCDTRGQLLGMASGDLYLLAGERTFHENYFKSSFGLWCRVCIVLGLAITLSTYLSGVITFLLTTKLFLAGYITEHLSDLAGSNSSVGGPFRSMNQILRAEQSTAPSDAGTLSKAAEGGDDAFSWLLRRVFNLIPDVEGFVWTEFLSEGFNIPLEYLVMNFVVMVGYLLPWFVLGYYLLRSREIAE